MSPRATCALTTALSIVLAAPCLERQRQARLTRAPYWKKWRLDGRTGFRISTNVLPTSCRRAAMTNFSVERCSTSPGQCLDHCRAGDASDCYATALVFQKIKNGRVPEALFLRACALGFVSGCTNRAAGMDKGSGNSCVIRTYELACDRNDPWACTMIGFHLVRGIGVERNNDRARKALSKSCRFGDKDEACAYARTLLKEIGN